MKTYSTKDDTKPMSLLSLILSFLALFVISALLFMPIESETRHIFIGLDFIICSVFILQLTIDLIRSNNRKLYLKHHWIDFIASIPMIEPLRFARLFHILRIILVIRSGRTVLKQLLANKRETTLASIILLLVILLTVGSGIMLAIEGQNPDSNIQTASDALWWAFVTISTVGYGDHYPITLEGKLLASGIIICGVGIFGMISGLITSLITSPSHTQNQRSENKEKLLEQIVAQQQQILQRLEKIEQKDSDEKK
ncbi:potassium channel family protein [Vibrio clamense]|uniref:potassium channel family protein n=1 Tax=Vibrio clamense TaxID=2910254 RepID=UPI003D1B107E